MGEFLDERFEQEAEQQQDQFPEVGEAPEFPDELVEDLQQLTVVGHLSDSFTYGGQDYVIRTMTIGEELEALRATKDYNDIPVASGRVYATAMVAGAMESHNGAPLVIPVSDKQDIVALKFRKVKDWYWPVIEVIYERFSALERKQKEILDSLENTLEPAEAQDADQPLE